MKKFLMAIILGVYMATSLAEPVKDSVCPPASAADVRVGYVNNDVWAYWWCRNSTDVWAIWTTWLEGEWKNLIWFHSHMFTIKPNSPTLFLNKWAGPVPLNANGVPVGREHLWTAAYAAIQADTNKPLPGTPNPVLTNLPELWVVTQNGSNPMRKTSKVVNGVVQAYGSGTQNVKIGLPCDHTKPSYPIGTLTKYLSLYEGPQDEVISCIRIQ